MKGMFKLHWDDDHPDYIPVEDLDMFEDAEY